MDDGFTIKVLNNILRVFINFEKILFKKMFLRKFFHNTKVFKKKLYSTSLLIKNFSGSHGHGHGHGEEDSPSSHKPFYDRVSYNKKLKKGEREP